jgi:hypothetical protein
MGADESVWGWALEFLNVVLCIEAKKEAEDKRQARLAGKR